MPGSMTYLMPGTVNDVSATLVASTTRRVEVGVAVTGQRVGGVPDFAFAAEEDQDVARPFGPQFGDGVGDGLHLVARFGRLDALLRPGGIGHQRPVADLDGVGAPGHLDDGRSATVFKVIAKSLGVDGG